MTNLEKWMHYTSGLTSPDNYLKWAWRYIVAASLQRRVWLPPDHQKCFPNMYLVFVGMAGIGKGLPIKKVSEFLKYWKQKDALKIKVNGEVGAASVANQELIEAIHAANIKNSQDSINQPKNKQAHLPDATLIPVAADATTYEALVQAVASSFRYVSYVGFDDVKKQQVIKSYGHSSICFSLQELASLLRKRTDDTVNYMLGLYDCPDEYIYDTKTQGKDMVRRGCLNLLAGTTPDFMQSIFDAKLINQGFGSRTFFIYANKDRKKQFFIPDLTDEQKQLEKELLNHILTLSSLYGRIQTDNKVVSFLEDWWASYTPSNRSHKLNGYYSRKKVHIMKVAMAEHFSDSTSLFIPVETYQKAISILEEEEKMMHLALVMETKNEQQVIASKIMEMLSSGPKNWVDIYTETFSLGPQNQIEAALSFLEDTEQLVKYQERDEDIDKQIVYWRKKE